MLNKKVLRNFVVPMILAVAISAVGCGKTEPAKPATPAAPAAQQVKIQIAGSTSVQPLSEELVKAYMAKNPNVRIDVAGGGSGAGIKAAQTGTADIGSSSRELTPEEKPTVKETVIAMDGIVVIVHKDNKVADLKKDDIKKIFLGQITDWSQVGGEKGPIRVVTRETGSGTRGAFEELVLGKDASGTQLLVMDKANVQNSTGAVRTAVAADKNAIGYISLGSMNADVKGVKVDGVEATVANIKANTYKISRPFLYMTQKEATGEVKKYIDWVLSSEGQEIVKKEFITIK